MPNACSSYRVARIAWTGHRPELFLSSQAAEQAVHRVAAELPRSSFLVGGQRGVDTWAAEAAHRLGIRFTLVLPLEVEAFASGWTAADRRRLEQTVDWAAEVQVVGGPSVDAAHTARNRVLATQAGLLVAVWTGQRGGGTAETIDFARAAGVPIRETLLPPSPSARLASGRGV
jgi:hypothetical protein